MLTESLKTEIINHLNSKTNTTGWVINYPEILSTEAIVYRISSSNYPIDIALKVFNQEHSFKTEKQYSAFERFSAALNTDEGEYRVPKIYGLFIDDNCFLMEWISGYSLRRILWKNCLRKTRLQTHIRASSGWLKYFHKNANLQFRKVDISRYTKGLELNCDNLEIEKLCNDNPVFLEGLSTINQFSDSFSDYHTMHADIHGDLSLKNIIINNKTVAGIDIGANFSAPVADDISQMLSYICINYFNMLTQIDMRKPPEFWEIFNVILDAYEYPKKEKERDFFLFVFLYQMLNRWVSAYKFHKNSSNHTFKMKLLGKWRLYNSKIIVNGLSTVIQKKINS